MYFCIKIQTIFVLIITIKIIITKRVSYTIYLRQFLQNVSFPRDNNIILIYINMYIIIDQLHPIFD